MIRGLLVTMLREIAGSAQQNHSGRKDYSGSEQYADDHLQPAIGHSFPWMPVTIISTAMTPTTPAKIQRSTRTLAPISCRAPTSDPVRTPSITGIARPGSI